MRQIGRFNKPSYFYKEIFRKNLIRVEMYYIIYNGKLETTNIKHNRHSQIHIKNYTLSSLSFKQPKLTILLLVWEKVVVFKIKIEI